MIDNTELKRKLTQHAYSKYGYGIKPARNGTGFEATKERGKMLLWFNDGDTTRVVVGDLKTNEVIAS